MIGEKIKLMKNLEIVDISDTIAGIVGHEAEPVLKAFAEALIGLPKLREFHCNCNAIGPRIGYFDKILTGQLTDITLCVTGMSAEACEIFANCCITNGPLPLKLRKLHFGESTSNSGGAIAISTLFQHCPYLEDFAMSSVRSAADGMYEICSQLAATKPPICKLNLSDNGFINDEIDASALSQMIESLSPTLEELVLNNITLEEKGFNQVAPSLALCNKMKKLHISGMDMDMNDVTENLLATSLPLLEDLNMAEFFVGDGARAIATALIKRLEQGHKMLRVLDLQTNEITDSGMYALLEAVFSYGGENGGFMDGGFRLDGNMLSEEGCSLLKHAFAAAGRGTELGSLDDNFNQSKIEHFSEIILPSLVQIPQSAESKKMAIVEDISVAAPVEYMENNGEQSPSVHTAHTSPTHGANTALVVGGSIAAPIVHTYVNRELALTCIESPNESAASPVNNSASSQSKCGTNRRGPSNAELVKAASGFVNDCKSVKQIAWPQKKRQ